MSHLKSNRFISVLKYVLTPNSTKAFNKLWPLLALVGDYLQRGSKLLVVVGKPLQQRHAFDQLVLLSSLSNTCTERGQINYKQQKVDIEFFIFQARLLMNNLRVESSSNTVCP